MENYHDYKSIDLKNWQSMDVEPRYTTDAGLDIGEDFLDTLQDLDIRLGIKIARFIADNIQEVEVNRLVSTILGGLVDGDNKEPITFALEIIKSNESNIMLSDLEIIDMDEYLDLLNLNKKTNGLNQSKNN